MIWNALIGLAVVGCGSSVFIGIGLALNKFVNQFSSEPPAETLVGKVFAGWANTLLMLAAIAGLLFVVGVALYYLVVLLAQIGGFFTGW